MNHSTEDGNTDRRSAAARYPDLVGKIALVTGSTRGIGLASARVLAENGATVIVNGRSQDRLDSTVRMLRADGLSAVALQGDARDPASVQSMLERVKADYGKLDVLVANVGGLGEPVPTTNLSLEGWRAAVDANLTATFLVISAFLPTMISQGAGDIVTIASTAGRQPSQASAAYSAAKAGVVMLTRHLASEFGPKGLRFNCVAPGAILTEDHPLRHASEEVRQRVAQMHPIQRLGAPNDVGQAVAFLVSEASAWITGVVIDVSGGRVTA